MTKSSTKPDLEALKTEVVGIIYEQVKRLEENYKIREKSMQNTIESLGSNMNLMEKQFNLRIGSIKGNYNREPKKQEDDILAEFDTFEEFQAWLDARQHKNVATHDKESNVFEQTEQHPLLDQ